MTQENKPNVLVFDSGVGGLTVVEAIREQAPRLRVDYCADTAFFPYGDKSDEELRDRVPSVARALVDDVQPEAFVIACNTASTLALDETRNRLNIPVIGTVPAIKPAVAQTNSGVIGLLATPGTLRRAYTADLLTEFASDIEVIQHGSVELVRLAEAVAEGEQIETADLVNAIAPMTRHPRFSEVDVIVLACTHFPLLRGLLSSVLPERVTLIDTGDAIARQTLRRLGQSETNANSRSTPTNPPATAWLTSDGPETAQVRNVLARFQFDDVKVRSV